MSKLKVFLFFILSIFSLKPNFKNITLTLLNKEVAKLPENPPISHDDWQKPRFTDFIRSTVPTFFQRKLINLNIMSPFFWSIHNFQELLEEVIAIKLPWKLSGRFVTALPVEPDSKFIVWGDINGSLHSLMRDLNNLKKENVIDDNLKIIKPKHYFIFLGNLTDKSAYSIETLTIILLLIKQNSEKLFYLRGNSEDRNNWENNSLARQLQIRAWGITRNIVPYSIEINNFFNTLPLALYVFIKDSKNNDAIRFSYLDRSQSLEINSKEMGNFFENRTEIHSHLLKEKSPTTEPIKTQAIIRGQQPKIISAPDNGFKILGFELAQTGYASSTDWSLISCPSYIYQKYLKFFNDSYLIVDIEKDVVSATGTLHYRDIRQTSLEFKQDTKYYITSGSIFNEKIKIDQEIKIGTSLAISRGPFVIGEKIKDGISIKILSENLKGGINFVPVMPYIFDDGFLPYRARDNVEDMAELFGINMLITPFGGYLLKNYWEYIANDKLAVFFPIAGASEFMSSKIKNIIFVRASYEDEVDALTSDLYKRYGIKDYAIIYDKTPGGLASLNAAKKTLKSLGVENITEISHITGDTDFKFAIETIKKSQPEGIGIFSTGSVAQTFIRQIGVAELNNKFLFGYSDTYDISLKEYLKESGLSMIFSHVVPNPADIKIPLIAQYQKDCIINNLHGDTHSLEAYIATALWVEAIKKISAPITKEKIMAELESLKNYDFDGLKLNFDPNKRTLATSVWLEQLDGEWIEQKIKVSNGKL